MAAALAGHDGHLTLLAVPAAVGSGAYATAAISPARVEQVLARAERIAADAGVHATTEINPGRPPATVILGRAVAFDVLVIGAPASSWFGGLLIGGVAAASLSRFRTPILLVRPAFRGLLRDRRIIVASDGGAGSDEIVAFAGELAASVDAQVSLVHALGPEAEMHPHRIAEQARRLVLAGRAGTPWIEPGRPWTVVANAARAQNAAIVVIGSRQLGGLRAFGSVSRRVVHGAPCSVLLLPPQPQPAGAPVAGQATPATTDPGQPQTASGTISIAPQGHSATQIPQPLQ